MSRFFATLRMKISYEVSEGEGTGSGSAASGSLSPDIF
jgi:hypothetical protein